MGADGKKASLLDRDGGTLADGGARNVEECRERPSTKRRCDELPTVGTQVERMHRAIELPCVGNLSAAVDVPET